MIKMHEIRSLYFQLSKNKKASISMHLNYRARDWDLWDSRGHSIARHLKYPTEAKKRKKTTFLLLFVHEGKKWQTKHKYLASLLSCVDRFKERTGEIFHDTNVWMYWNVTGLSSDGLSTSFFLFSPHYFPRAGVLAFTMWLFLKEIVS